MAKQPQGFDIIVVGGGSAGCVVAGRLASVPGLRVLLLEAGGSGDLPWLNLPGGYYRTLRDTTVDWGDVGIAEQGIGGRQIRHRHGKVLGGGSAVNGMVYIRGAAEDYDSWAAETGDPSWSYRSVLPLFKRSEDNRDFDNEYHGIGGPIPVARPPYTNPFAEGFLEAATSVGLPLNPDFNGISMYGAGRYQMTASKLQRSSSANFLRNAGANLEVRLNQHVSRVLIERGKAVGVEIVTHGGSPVQISCERDVILCAGAIGTPCILQRSGIGPAPLLDRLGVPVALDNADVGSNLQDHLQVRVVFATDPGNSLNELQREIVASEFEPGSAGDELSVAAGFVGLFARTTDHPVPDIQFHLLPFGEGEPGHLHSAGAATISACLLRPRSRGSVQLTSADPFAKPRIDCSYLKDAADAVSLREGLRLLGRIAGKMRYEFDGVLSPIDFNAPDSVLDEYVRTIASTIYHPVGTCAMARSGGLVNARLQVKGVGGLRIADASIMPSIVSGNTNAACLMIGERAADEIEGTLGRLGP